MHAEHRRPLYAFGILALASALLVGQGLRTHAIYDYIVGGRGQGSMAVAAGSTISAAPDSDNAARGTTAVAVPERRTVTDRPAPVRATRPARAAQPATRAPGRSHQAPGRTHASGSRGNSGQAARSGRVALDGSERTLRTDRAGNARTASSSTSQGKKSTKTKATKSKATKTKATKTKATKSKSKKAKSKKTKPHARNGR